MVSSKVFNLYKSYLVKVAQREGRPFRLPKNTKTLEERSDLSFFIVLEKKMKDKLIDHKKKYETFFEVASKELESFHISDIVTNFETLLPKYQDYKEDTLIETKRKIKVAFDNLTKYVIINNIESEDVLYKGSPPKIMKLWKEGAIDERVLVSMYDMSKVKSKPWFRVYCGELASKYKKLTTNINNNVNLSSFIEGELVKFKTIFNK
jgi:hypothetical protein